MQRPESPIDQQHELDRSVVFDGVHAQRYQGLSEAGAEALLPMLEPSVPAVEIDAANARQASSKGTRTMPVRTPLWDGS